MLDGLAAIVGGVTSCNDDDDALSLQPPADKTDRLYRSSVQPLRIVDHPHQWVRSGCARNEPKHRHADEEPIWRRTTRTAERRFERILMTRIELYETVDDRFAESL